MSDQVVEDNNNKADPRDKTSSASFDKISINDKHLEVLDTDCLICMEAMQLREEVVKMVCHHYYHLNCIAEWLKQKSSCPQCRQTINDNPFLEPIEDQSEHESESEPNVEFVLRGVPPEDMIDAIIEYEESYRQYLLYDSDSTEDES